jgi:hypothetical protein
MYGLTRNLSKTAPAFHRYLFNVLKDNGIEYDLFIHTYRIEGAYHNMWSNEHTNNYKNEDVQSLLKPKHFIFDNQSDIISTIPFEDYHSMPLIWVKERPYHPRRVKPMIQNLCLGLYSKLKVTELFSRYHSHYSAAMIIRPDLLLKSPFDISLFKLLSPTNIIIPTQDNHCGCNDRLCIGKPLTIMYVGNMFRALLMFSKHFIVNSERFMQHHISKFNVIKAHIPYQTLRIHH